MLMLLFGLLLLLPSECLTIWNTKFQTLQTSKELPLGTSGQVKLSHGFGVLGLCAFGSREGTAGLQSSAAAGGAVIATSAEQLMSTFCQNIHWESGGL